MKRTQLGLAAIFILALSGFMSLAHGDDAKTDLTGTWTWSFQGQNGNTINSSLKLKQDGDKITGSLTGRNGTENPIKEAQLKGDDLTFKVTRTRNDQEITTTYTGKVTADEIKGKSETDMNGQMNSRDWDAKRSTDSSTTKPAQ